jgi:hypothetical protein
MLILGTVVDQQQEPGRGEALDQTVEAGLRLCIDPLQILDNHQKRLFLAFTQEQVLPGLQGLAAALARLKGLPSGFVDRHIAGIHFPFSSQQGLVQGRCIGQVILDRMQFTE